MTYFSKIERTRALCDNNPLFKSVNLVFCDYSHINEILISIHNVLNNKNTIITPSNLIFTNSHHKIKKISNNNPNM